MYGQTNFYRISLATLGFSDTIELNVIPASDDDLLIFPNPARAHVGITYPTLVGHTIRVSDSRGSVMFQKTHASVIPGLVGGSYVKLDLTRWERGNYFVSVVVGGMVAHSGGFLKL